MSSGFRMHGTRDRLATPDWLSPRQALERFAPPETLRLQTADNDGARVRYGYRVGTLSFLIPPGTGSEVVPLAKQAAMPNGPSWLLGVMNLRGALVPVFDLAGVLGVDRDRTAEHDDRADGAPMVLVLDKGQRAAGVLIDGFPLPLTGLRAVEQMPPLPDVLRAHVAAAWATDDAIWLELAHQGLLMDLGTTAECTAA